MSTKSIVVIQQNRMIDLIIQDRGMCASCETVSIFAYHETREKSPWATDPRTCILCALHNAQGNLQKPLMSYLPPALRQAVIRSDVYRIRYKCPCGYLAFGTRPPECPKCHMRISGAGEGFTVADEMEILRRTLGETRGIEPLIGVIVQWAGLGKAHVPNLPRATKEIEEKWSCHKAKVTGIYPHKTKLFVLPAVMLESSKKFFEAFEEAVESAIEALGIDHVEILIYPHDRKTYNDAIDRAYGTMEYQIRRLRERTKSQTEQASLKIQEGQRRGVVYIREIPSEVQNARDLWTFTIKAAYERGASDVHVRSIVVDEQGSLLSDPQAEILFRIDDNLETVCRIDWDTYQSLIQVIKETSGIKGSTILDQQDGNFVIDAGGRAIYCRVAMGYRQRHPSKGVPLIKVTCRILDPQIIYENPDELGYNGPAGRLFFKTVMAQLQGMVLIAGATGTGKSTTMHIIARKIHHMLREQGFVRNFVSAEQPIEYRQHFIDQGEVDDEHNTFSDYARSFMRHDPDIIILGEIRDQETMTNAIRLAASGHLLMSTIHASTLDQIFQRIATLGADASSVAGNVLGLAIQALVHRPCSACAIKTDLATLAQSIGDEMFQAYSELVPVVEQARISLPETVLAGTGTTDGGETCPECSGRGVRGRINVMEFVVLGRHMRKLINESIFSSLNLYDIVDAAIRDGRYVTMLEDAARKAEEERVDGRALLKILVRSRVTLDALAQAYVMSGKSNVGEAYGGVVRAN